MKKIQKNIQGNPPYVALSIKKLELGTRLPFNIYIQRDNGYVIIIESGTLLDDKIYALLSKQKTLYVLKDDKTEESVNCNNILTYIQYNKDMSQKSLHFLYEINAKLFIHLRNINSTSSNSECVESIVNSIIFLVKNRDSYLKNAIQYFLNEYKLDVHSLHVAIYAVNLGYFIGLNQNELYQVGIAGLMLDIGMFKVEDSIRYKASKLNKSELHLMQQHPKFSVEIINHNHIHKPYIIEAVLHHHERYDGSGYPDKLRDNQISKFASILAICDVFDALTINRPYRKNYTYFEALKFMMKDLSMKDKFNTHYLQVFLKSLI